MFDPVTMQESAPTQQERREFNRERWLAEVLALGQARTKNAVALGRKFRQARGEADYRTLVAASGFGFLTVEGFVRQANEADGVVAPERKRRERDPLKVTKEMAAAILEFEDRPDELFDYMRSRARG